MWTCGGAGGQDMVESGDVLVNWKEATNPAANLKVGVSHKGVTGPRARRGKSRVRRFGGRRA